MYHHTSSRKNKMRNGEGA
jgi:hypothetical protein